MGPVDGIGVSGGTNDHTGVGSAATPTSTTSARPPLRGTARVAGHPRRAGGRTCASRRGSARPLASPTARTSTASRTDRGSSRGARGSHATPPPAPALERTQVKIAAALPHSCRLRAAAEAFLRSLFEDSQLNVYAFELEVRPPGAPTTPQAESGGFGDLRSDNLSPRVQIGGTQPTVFGVLLVASVAGFRQSFSTEHACRACMGLNQRSRLTS